MQKLTNAELEEVARKRSEGEYLDKRELRLAPCEKCGGMAREWEAWGSYLDKDLKCKVCGHTIDIWDC